jgi:sulfur carrier protein ThiS
MDFITVKVGKLPGTIKEIALNGDRTVRAALQAAELVATGYQIRVNGSDADLDTRLYEGQNVFLVKKIKGNADHIVVKVGKLPGAISEIALNGDRTVKAALQAAELNATGYQIRVNGDDADLDTRVYEGSSIFLVKKIKGNADHIMVKVGKLPGAISEIALNGDRTVRAALQAAELNATGYQIRVNGDDADLDTRVYEGSSIFLVKKIKGN